MLAYKRQKGWLAATANRDQELRAPSALRVNSLGPYVGCGLESKGHNPTSEVAPELRDVLIVRVEHGGSSGRKRLDELVLSASNAGQRIEELNVHRRHAGHHSGIGLSDLGQRLNFAQVRHPHLDDRHVVLRLKLQEHKRQAKVVVEVAFGLQHAVASRENVRDGFLRGRLTCRPGHADERLAPQPANRSR